MQSATRRLTAILTHFSPPQLPAAVLPSAARHRVQSFHTRIARTLPTPLTDANIAIARLPTALPQPTANPPTSPPHSAYASVWSAILASSSSSSPFSTVSASPASFEPIIAPQSAADAGKLTVVLDMDECLLHSTFDDTLPATTPPGDLTASPPLKPLQPPYRHPTAGYPYDVTLTIGDPLEGEQRVYVSFRPYLLQFLHALHSRYEVILFTSALPVYAAPVLAYLTSAVQQLGSSTNQPLFRHQLYRSATVPFASFPYVKDIRRLGRSLHRTVLVDNNALAMLATPDNAVLVPDWTGGEGEVPEVLREVLRLVEWLDGRTCGEGVAAGEGSTEGGAGGDVRPLLRHALRFREELEQAGIDFAANGVS